MKVTCVSIEIPSDLRQKAGWATKANPRYKLTVGKAYDVYNLAIPFSTEKLEPRTPWAIFCLINDQDRFSQVPQPLVRLENEEIPKAWKVWISSGWLNCGYEVLQDVAYFEALTEGAPWAMSRLKNECTIADCLEQLSTRPHDRGQRGRPDKN